MNRKHVEKTNNNFTASEAQYDDRNGKHKRYPYLAIGLSSATGILALLALLSWWSGLWNYTTLGLSNKPMAVDTALALLLLSGSAVLYFFKPSVKFSRWFSFLAILCIAILSILVLSQYLGEFDLGFETWLLGVTGNAENIALGKMSPLTPLLFLLILCAYFLELLPYSSRWLVRQTASIFALATLMISLIILLSYSSGVPILYKGQIVPMALLTALSFILLSFGIMLAAGQDTFPLSLYRIREYPNASRPSRWISRSLALMLLFTIPIGMAAFFSLRYQLTESRRVAQNELLAITDLKVSQISYWYQERIGDAESILYMPTGQDEIRDFLTGSNPAAARDALAHWLTILKEEHGYREINLFNQEGKTLISISRSGNPSYRPSPEEIQTTLKSTRVRIIDLHRPKIGQKTLAGIITLDMLVPLRINSSKSELADGVIQLQIDPNQFLYPLIQSWPIPSSTAETLLVRREGNEVLFLNELRHQDNTALNLLLPVDPSNNLPAAIAVMGKEGIVDGIDYRGVPVLAAIRSIPETPWFIVAKIDQEEIYAELQQNILFTGGLTFTLILVAGLIVSLLERRREGLWLRKQLTIEQERQALADRILNINKYANDAIILTDQNWNILEANERASKSYGYSLEEFKNMHMKNLCAPSKECACDLEEKLANTIDDTLTETYHRRKDGFVFPVEISYSFIEIGGKEYHQTIIRDITERKHAEEILRESEKRFHSLFENMLDGFAYCEMKYKKGKPEDFIYREVNNAFATLTGLENVVGRKVTEVIPGIRDSNPELFEIFGRVASTGKPEEFETYLYPLKIWLSISVYSPAKGDFVAVFDNITERKKAEETFRLLNERFELAARAAHFGVWDWDLQNNQLIWDEQMYRLYGVKKEDFPGAYEAWLNGVHPDDLVEYNKITEQARHGEPEYNNEFRVVWPNGTIRHLMAHGQVIKGADGVPKRMIGINYDITDLKLAQERVTASLQEKTILLKEIHHRVKNNLNMISSLLDLQSERIDDSNVLLVFRESQNRIRAIARLHESLYRSRDLGHIMARDYLHEMALYLIEAHKGDYTCCDLDIQIDNITLDLDLALPIGLIVNELVTNCLKHAFPYEWMQARYSNQFQPDKNQISIVLHITKDSLILSVSDNGIGFPDGIQPENVTTQGLQLVSLLTHQLGGTLDVQVNDGTTFSITMEKPKELYIDIDRYETVDIKH